MSEEGPIGGYCEWGEKCTNLKLDKVSAENKPHPHTQSEVETESTQEPETRRTIFMLVYKVGGLQKHVSSS